MLERSAHFVKRLNLQKLVDLDLCLAAACLFSLESFQIVVLDNLRVHLN